MTIDDGHQQALKCCSVGRDIVIKRYYDDLKDLLLAVIASSGNLFVFLSGENLYGDYRKVVHQQSKLISQTHFSTILIFDLLQMQTKRFLFLWADRSRHEPW
jgi:hypothetical protein